MHSLIYRRLTQMHILKKQKRNPLYLKEQVPWKVCLQTRTCKFARLVKQPLSFPHLRGLLHLSLFSPGHVCVQNYKVNKSKAQLPGIWNQSHPSALILQPLRDIQLPLGHCHCGFTSELRRRYVPKAWFFGSLKCLRL